MPYLYSQKRNRSFALWNRGKGNCNNSNEQKHLDDKLIFYNYRYDRFSSRT